MLHSTISHSSELCLDVFRICKVRQYAAYALVKVGQNSDVRKQVTDEGGLEPVLYLARTNDPEVQRETLACLCSLSFAEENKMNITKYGGLPPIMNAIRSPDEQTARMACCACANLCEMVENMDDVVDAGGIAALVQVRRTSVLPASLVAYAVTTCESSLSVNKTFGDHTSPECPDQCRNSSNTTVTADSCSLDD